MYKTLLFLIFIFCNTSLIAQNEFITTWEATDTDLSITIPTDSANFTYDYTVDFGDGTILNNQTGDVTHTYSTAGDYTVKISGDFPKFYGAQIPGNIFTQDLLSVEQWGNIQWESMANAFRSCSRLTINATDVPDLSNVTDISNIFRLTNINAPSISNWDVSNITNMHAAFYSASDFTQPLDNWDVSNVTDMSYMFKSNHGINGNLNNWDVSNVTNMEHMFENSFFNEPLDNWDVSSVTNMQNMFYNADFNQPINNWNVSSVTNMSGMFGPGEFNQPLNNWDVSNVTDMSYMFVNSDFNHPLNNWDVSSVTGNGFYSMFNLAEFNQDLSSWDFNVTDFDHFVSASAMDTQNFDLLLDRFAQLGIEDGDIDTNELEYCDIFTVKYLEENLGWNLANLDVDLDLGSNCNLNYILGKVTYDTNLDGCDNSDPGLTQFSLNIDNGQESISTLTDQDGNFTIAAVQDTYTVSVLNLPDYVSMSPSSQTVVPLSGINEIENNVDFCVTPNLSISDLSVDVFPIDDAIPGFESDYEFIIENKGTDTESNVELIIEFANQYQSYVSSSISPASTSTPDSIVIDIPDVPVLGKKVVTLKLLNAQPPGLNSGDDISITTEVTPVTGDDNPTNNTVVFTQTVVNSYDPNDKLVTQGDEITIDETGEYLDYKIRFQNVGTANALNVKITDTISNKLDWTTFQPINSSHNYRLELNDQEEINFYFDNINLPYESLDEEGSNGHVSFRIKPQPDVQIGDVIENKAYIFFDFNAPIITNTVSTAIVDNLSSLDFDESLIQVYPNPTSGTLHIDLPHALEVENLKVFDITGKEVFTSKYEEDVDLDPLSRGLYILNIYTNNGVYQKKLIKE